MRFIMALIYFIVDNHLSFALCRDTPFLPSPTGEGVTTVFGFSPLGETGKGVKEKSKEVCQLYFIYERVQCSVFCISRFMFH